MCMLRKERLSAVVCAMFIFLLTVSIGYGAGFEMDSQTGKTGDRISFTVNIRDAPNKVSAMGFDVVFNPTVLRYMSFEKGELLQNRFGFFDVNEYSSGSLRIGGFDSNNNPIPAGQTGTLIFFSFEVVGGGGSAVAFSEMVDDIAGWTAKNGQFVFASTSTTVIIQPDVTTTTSPPVSTTTVDTAATTTSVVSTTSTTTEITTTTAEIPEPAATSTAPTTIMAATTTTAENPAPSTTSTTISSATTTTEPPVISITTTTLQTDSAENSGGGSGCFISALSQ